MKKILMVMGLLFASGPAMAETVFVNVNGMVCAFCAVGIERAFTKMPEVSNIDVNLDNKYVCVELGDEGNIGDPLVSQIITDNGFDVVSIERREEPCDT